MYCSLADIRKGLPDTTLVQIADDERSGGPLLVEGTVTAVSAAKLIDSAASFPGTDIVVRVGDFAVNPDNGRDAEISAIDSATQLALSADIFIVVGERYRIVGFSDLCRSRVEEAIKKADGEIDLLIGSRYAVPLATVPDAVRGWSVDIALYRLYLRTQEAMPESRRAAYKDAIAALKEVRDGRMDLPVPLASGDEDGFGSSVVISDHFGQSGGNG